MRITMISVGSTGDVRPYVILGKELKRRGHDVSICAFSMFEQMVCREGLTFKPMRGDIRELMGYLMNGSTGVAFLKQARDGLVRLMDPLLEDMEAAVEDCEAIIGTYLGQIYYSLAEIKHVPYIQTQFFPMDCNKEAPMAAAPGQKVGKAWNVTTYRLGHLLVSMLEKYYLSEWREKHGMSPRKLLTSPKYELNGHIIPVLYAMSPLVMPRPAEWGENIHMTGFWLGKGEVNYTPDPALEAFLKNGEKPIYVGFGSMVNAEMRETLDVVLEALRQSNTRAVLSTGWGGVKIENTDDIFVADFVPHDWLFQHVAAVVHHGGAGTTAAGIQAGRPTLIVPFGGDQPFWGTRAEDLGIGPKPIPRDKLTVSRLSKAFTDLKETKKYAVAARELGERLQNEDGAHIAANIIEHELRKWLRLEGREPNIL